jgi:hypothetical protein
MNSIVERDPNAQTQRLSSPVVVGILPSAARKGNLTGDARGRGAIFVPHVLLEGPAVN